MMKARSQFHALTRLIGITSFVAFVGCGGKGTLKRVTESTGGGGNVVVPGQQTTIPTPTPPIPALLAFSAETGSAFLGEVIVKTKFKAADNLRISKVVIRRKKGAVPPAADCLPESGDLVQNLLPPFSDTNYSDNTQTLSGEFYSYRACIFSSDGRINSDMVSSNIQGFDLPGVTALPAFSAMTSSTTDGVINLMWSYPTERRQIKSIEIWRVAGNVAPALDASTGVRILNLLPPFTMTSLADQTGDAFGGFYSYRVRIFDMDNSVTGTNIAVNLKARDTTSPANFPGFTGEAGTNEGAIKLTVTFPSVVTDIERVAIAKQKGSAAPAAATTGCGPVDDMIELAPPYTANQQVSIQYLTGSRTGEGYSFRLCSVDRSGNVNQSSTLTNVQAKFLGNPSCSLTLSAPSALVNDVLTVTMTTLGAVDSATLDRGIGVVSIPNSGAKGLPSNVNGTFAVMGTVTGPAPLPNGTCSATYTINPRTVTNFLCDSNLGAKKVCVVPNAIQILSLDITANESNTDCTPDFPTPLVYYGLESANSIFVNYGCRARFTITYR